MTAARRAAAEAWAFRARVEQEAALRFDRLATIVASFDSDSPVPAMMRRAADDERRHTELCARLASTPGSPVTLDPAAELPVIAPRSLDARQAALYEVVAACCITETESMATLTTLLAAEPDPEVREVLHAISRDEVVHARMGWAHLAREASVAEVAFLGPLVPGDARRAPSTPHSSPRLRRTRTPRRCSGSASFRWRRSGRCSSARWSRSSSPGSSGSGWTPSPAGGGSPTPPG